MEYGINNGVSYEEFVKIWRYLSTMRRKFEPYARGGYLGRSSFQNILQKHVRSKINKEFIAHLTNFYRRQLTFDAFVHAARHMEFLVEMGYDLISSCLIREFEQSVYEDENVIPSASTENEVALGSFQPFKQIVYI